MRIHFISVLVSVLASRGLANSNSTSVSVSSMSRISFYAMSDTPFGTKDRTRWRTEIIPNLERARPEFLVHLGNIKERQRSTTCNLQWLYYVANTLSPTRQHNEGNGGGALSIPALVLPGDHDWYLCDDDGNAWEIWKDLFVNLEDDWKVARRTWLSNLERQDELFAFRHKRVLFLGLHVIDATVRDWDEWNARVHRSTVWMEDQLQKVFSDKETEGDDDDVEMVILMSHTAPHERRYKEFHQSLKNLGVKFPQLLDRKKRIVYIHGNGKEFAVDKRWIQLTRSDGESNRVHAHIQRVTLTPGVLPTEIIIDPDSRSHPVSFRLMKQDIDGL